MEKEYLYIVIGQESPGADIMVITEREINLHNRFGHEHLAEAVLKQSDGYIPLCGGVIQDVREKKYPGLDYFVFESSSDVQRISLSKERFMDASEIILYYSKEKQQISEEKTIEILGRHEKIKYKNREQCFPNPAFFCDITL